MHIYVLLRKASSRKFFVIRKLEYETDLNCPLLGGIYTTHHCSRIRTPQESRLAYITVAIDVVPFRGELKPNF